MTEIDLNAIRARADAATAGPWAEPELVDDAPGDEGWWILNGAAGMEQHAVCVTLLYSPGAQSDAEFIAHARADVPALLALVDAQAARIDKALATCSKYQAAADVVVHPVRADAWRVLSDHVRRALTEDTT